VAFAYLGGQGLHGLSFNLDYKVSYMAHYVLYLGL
jgi:hypothetical protein